MLDFEDPTSVTSIGDGATDYSLNNFAAPWTLFNILTTDNLQGIINHTNYYYIDEISVEYQINVFDMSNTSLYTSGFSPISGIETTLFDLGVPVNNFEDHTKYYYTIEFRITDAAGNTITNSSYLGDSYNYDATIPRILVSNEVTIQFDNNLINVNEIYQGIGTIVNFTLIGADNSELQNHSIKVKSGNYYLEITLWNETSQRYEVRFDSLDDLILYSENIFENTLVSNYPLDFQLNWDATGTNYYAFAKHASQKDPLVLSYFLQEERTSVMDISEREGFRLLDYINYSEVFSYLYNGETGKYDIKHNFDEIDFTVSINGSVSWNVNFSQYNIEDDLVFFNYYGSDYAKVIKDTQKDGLFLKILVPNIYSTHGTIERLQILFIDFDDNRFVYSMDSLDFDKYFKDASQYKRVIPGLSELLEIPIYIDFASLTASNLETLFDITKIHSVSFVVSDAPVWPGSVSMYDPNTGFTIINFPYQIFGISQMSFYDILANDSALTVYFNDYQYNFIVDESMSIELDTFDSQITEMEAFSNLQTLALNQPNDLFFTDIIDIYFRINSAITPFPLYEMATPFLVMTDNLTGTILGVSFLEWDNSVDKFHSRFSVTEELGSYDLIFTLYPTVAEEIVNSTNSVEIELIPQILSQIALKNEREVVFNPDYTFTLNTKFDVDFEEELNLMGYILDNSTYYREREIIPYIATDPIGEFTLTEYEIDLNGLIGETEFIDKNNFKLEFIDRENYNEITPLFEVVNGSSFNYATNVIEDSWISYYAYYRTDHPNKFMLIINWTSDNSQLIPYDTNLLLTYKVIQGRIITPVTFEDIEDVIIPVDFRMFSYETFEWENSRQFDKEILDVNPIFENSSLYTSVAQDQTIQVVNSSIGSGIISLKNVWKEISVDEFELLNDSYYTYSIVNESGVDALNITYTESGPINLKVEYGYIPKLKLTHYAMSTFLVNSTIKVMVDNAISVTPMIYGIDYDITGVNNNYITFYTFYSSVTPNYEIDDAYFLAYYGYLTEEINPVKNMILEFLDDTDGLWKPLARVPLREDGNFDYSFYMGENGLQFPLNVETIMRLIYLPPTLAAYNDQYIGVDYSGFNSVYNTSFSVNEVFTLTVNGKQSKISYIPTEFSRTFDQWATIQNRVYTTTTSPYETLQVDKPYTYFDFHRTITDNYEFQFELTDERGDFLADQLVWMEIGFKPKAGLNYKILDWEDEDGNYIDSEALGTAWFTEQGQEVVRGPGVLDPTYSVSRMFTRPESWEYLDSETGQVAEYSSLFWDYQITDNTGIVSFNVSLDEDLIEDHHRIFDESLFSSGSVTFDSLDDYRLYIRVFHAPVYDIGHMAFDDASQLYMSQDNNVFDLDRVSELDGYDYKDTTFYSGGYGEGLITIHPEDLMLGVPNLLVYQMGSELNDTFSFSVEIAEADVVPDAELMTIAKLETSFETNNLIPEDSQNIYLIDGMPIIAMITDYSGESVFEEGLVQFSAYVDSDGVATFNISDHYLDQLIPGVYQVNIFTIPREYTKDVYRFISLEVRPENWMKFGEPTMTLDLLNWFDSGWGGTYFGSDYAFYEDIYPRLTGYLATLHSDEGISDYINFKVSAKARDIGDTTDWSEFSWIELGDEDLFISSLVYDGLYYFEYPLGQDGDMLMGKEVILNISADATYNQTGMIADNREQKLFILNLTLTNSSIRTDSVILDSYSDSDIGEFWIGNLAENYGVERYFEYTDDIDTYGIDSDDILLNLNGYTDIIDIVEVRGIYEYDEVILIEGAGNNYTVIGDYSIVINSGTTLDNYSDLVISYTVKLEENKVKTWTFSETNGFEFSEILFNTDTTPLQLDHVNYLGVYNSIFNESYTLDISGMANLDVGFIDSDITLEDVKIYNITDNTGQKIEDLYELSIINNNKQIRIDVDLTGPKDVFIKYGIASYKLDRGYQRTDMNMTDAVRKLSRFRDSHKLYNHSSSTDINLLTIPDDPQDPLDPGIPKILIPILKDNKTTISFNYLALLYDSVLNGSFFLDDAVLYGNVSKLKPILATFTFTTEDGESYFDYVSIDPSTGENRFDFEINLQPMYAVKGYTTYDIEIDFLTYGNNTNITQYVIFDKFELTADDRILQVIDKPMKNKRNEINVAQTINTAHYAQIFTDRLNEAYDVVDDAWVTIAVEGFNDYGELVKLYKDENNYDELTFEVINNNSYSFKSEQSQDYRLTESLGLHINAYDLELPEYIEGEVNLYAGKGTEPYGEVFVDAKEFNMNWQYSDYTVDVSQFNDNIYNTQNFELSTQPLTSQYMYVDGDLYLHHRVDLTDSNNIISSGLPSEVQFAIEIPNATTRIDHVDINTIDRISTPWVWVESWQGFALKQDDYIVYNPDNADTYTPSTVLLTEGTHYDLVITEQGENQIHFYETKEDIILLLTSNTIQLDLHINYEFIEFDYSIDEPANTYSPTLHWKFPDSSYLFWDQFEYHPDLTSATTFSASFYHLSEYAPMSAFMSSTTEEFQFYPNEYNFTEFIFTGFDDRFYEVSLNLTNGGEFDDIIQDEQWDRINPFGITIQTEAGERYVNEKYMISWSHDDNYPTEPIYTFTMVKEYFEYLNILNDTEVLVTYNYMKESSSYYTKYDDILYGSSYTFTIRDSLGNIIQPLGNISSIQGNNITFTDSIKQYLTIGENFTIEYSFKTKGGLLDTKHFFIEIQPYEMKFYNNYYPFSGSSIVAPLYYNLSANYQYQLALNYRLQEKSFLTFSTELSQQEASGQSAKIQLGQNDPLGDSDGFVIVAYFINSSSQKEIIEDDYVNYDLWDNSVTITNFDAFTEEDTLVEGDSIYVMIMPETHNKYQPFHHIQTDLSNKVITLESWTVAQDPTNNLIANLESNNLIYGASAYDPITSGIVKQVYGIINSTNNLTYYLTEELDDASNGWKDYDTLIIKMGLLNPDVLEYLNVSFYYNNNTYIGYTNVTSVMFADNSGAVYIRLPNSPDFQYFTVANNAHITFSPTFYQSDDYLGFFYEEGLPSYQSIEWEANKVEDGYLTVDLDKEIFSLNEQVYVLNDQYEFLYAVSPGVREQEENYNGQSYIVEYNNASLPGSYILGSDTMKMKNGDLLFLKYNASLEESIGITVEDMVLQKSPFITNYKTELNDVPIAEISLLGINNDGLPYTTGDLYENRDKLVAWETSLDLTPFESELYNEYRQTTFNVSLDDIYSDFKTLDTNNVEHSYITDILITSNDPRYELIIDSVFLFEFEENTTLYDSDIFDIFENNHLEKFYVGDYANIYSESIILDASEFLPLYQDDPAINETYYFDAFDSDGNWYYFDEHLSGQETTSGVYDITWNPQYNEEYYYAYRDQDSDLQDLFEYYNPHIDTFRYLYLSWADQNAWNEWHTIETPNVNISTMDITFEWYDEILEEYQSVAYDQSLNEFEARHIAIENIFPYNSEGDTDTFDLSQDYSDAQNLEIMMIKGLFFNESEVDFDPADSNFPDGESIQIQAPNSISLRNFEKVIVYLNFTEGAYSDYTQFRLLQNGKDKSGPPAWTKNDSIYVDYEYNDIDYFLLMEDYAVGSDDSLFEYLEYVRNVNFVIYNTLTSEYEFNNDIQLTDFANFSRKDDKRTALELYDFSLDGEHELVIQSQDVDIDGIYDVYKYGEVNSAGEIVFHTTLIKTKTTNVETQKTSDVRSTKYYEIAGDNTIFGDKFYVENKNGIPYMVGTLFGRRTLITNTTTTSTTTKTTVIIQKDLDLDGLIDKDITFEASSTFSETTTYTTEIMGFFLDDVFSTKMFPEGTITELRDSFVETSAKSHLFTFRDYEYGEVSSVRIYEDTFANELSAKYDPNTYLKVITNDNGDEDPSNDLTLQAPALEELLGFTHTTDNVPALFDSKTTITDSLVFENILTVQKTVSIPDSLSRSDKVSSTLEVIQIIPDDGKVIIDSNPKTNPRKVDVGGEYWFYSSAQDGVFDTIFVVNRDEKVLAIGFDYDYNSHFEPNKKIFSEKHLISSTSSGLWDFSNLGPQNRVFLRDYNSYDGYFLDDVFSDSLYDVWKIMYNTETSTLMREVSAITSSQFVQSIQGRMVQDILWQVGAALISTLFGIVTHTGTAGFILMYAILSALNAMKQAHDNTQLVASQTLYNEDYDGAITLSSKNEADRVWGGSIPDMIIGSSAGVYSDVFLEYDNHDFKGALILAPQGWKKTNWGSNFPISLDYAIQTRDYSGYSDIDDPRLSPHSFTSTQSPNAIMGLENAINKETNGEYNKLYPYLQRNDGVFVPTFQFAGANTGFPIPEFYHEYPIFVDSSSYSTVENDQFTIYKIFDTESSQDIELIPEDKIHMIYADIQQIDVYQYEYLGIDSNGNDIHNNRFVGSYLNHTFSFSKTTGVLTLGDSVYSYLISNAQAKASAYIGDPDYEVFYVFEIKVSKYQALDPTNSDENRVATMQAIEQNILEYTYQYRNAQITQETLSQMCYTVFVTTISTILTVGATFGIGKLAKYLTKGASAAMIPTFTQSLLDDVSKWAIRPTIGTMIAGMAASTTLVKFITSPIFESLQEIFTDPLLEIVVSELVAGLGLDIFMQVFINSLVEGGRESITGPMSQFLFGDTQTNTQNLVSERHITNEISAEKAALETISERESHIKIKPQWSSIIKTGASLVLGAALVGIGGPMFFSGTLVAGFSAIKTFSKSFKIHKTIIHNIVVQSSSSESAKIISDLDMVGISDVMQDITDDGKLSPVPNNLEDGVVIDGKFYLFNDPNEQILPVGQVSGAAVLPNPKLIKALSRMFTATEAFMNKLIRYNGRKVSLNAYNRFTSRLKDKLSEVFGIDFFDTQLANFFEVNENYFTATRYQIGKGNLEKVTEKFLFDLLSIAKLKLYQKSVIEEKNHFDDILDILDVFTEYYETPVYQTIENPSYLPLLTLSRSLALIFYKAKIIDKQSVRIFEKKFKVAFSATLSLMRSDASRGITPSIYAKLFGELKSKHSEDLQAHNVYDSFIKSFDIFFATVSANDLVPLEISHTPRGKLVGRLIALFPQGSLKSRIALSLLLYGHRYNLFESFFGQRVYTNPALETLTRMIQNIEDLTTTEFEKITHYAISHDDLVSIQQKASRIIRNFINRHSKDTEPEMLSRAYMKYIFNARFRKYPKGSVKWLQGVGGLLELDGYNEKLRLAIEYNGPQHYDLEFHIKVYKLSRDVALKRLQRIQQNDKLKVELCKKNGVDLIVVPYTVKYSDMQAYISDEYKRLTGTDAPQKKIKNYRNILSSF